MLYNDRKMKKWQGFILAEHGTALTESNRMKQQIVKEKELLTDQEIGAVLDEAFRRQLPVNIQLNCKENGLFKADIVGVIQGFEDEFIYVATMSGTEAIERSLIKNVESAVNKKWYQ